MALPVSSVPADLHRWRNALTYGDKAGLVARVGFDENARSYGDGRSVSHLEARDRRGRGHGAPKAFAAAVVAYSQCYPSRAAILGGDDAVGHVGVREFTRPRRDVRYQAVSHARRGRMGCFPAGGAGRGTPSL